MYPKVENMIVVPINKTSWDYYEYPRLSHFMNELPLYGKWWREKPFLQIQSTNIMYPNAENTIVAPINKNNHDYYEYPSLSHFRDELWL